MVFRLFNVGPTITTVDTNTKTCNSVTIKLTKATDAGIRTIKGYQYYSNATKSWSGTEGASKTFSNLEASTQYSFYVRVVDNLDNVGAQVEPYSVTTKEPLSQPAVDKVAVGDSVNYSANGYDQWKILDVDKKTGKIK